MTIAVPQTMKALLSVITRSIHPKVKLICRARYDKPRVQKIVEVPVPALRANDVLVGSSKPSDNAHH